MDGLLVVDKPAGPTSHDVVARVRRVLRERRVGHTGTLDPMATGVLPLVVGRATRLARFLSDGDKSYEAVVRLGFATDTGDALGTPLSEPQTGALPSREVIRSALESFRGTFLQQPPAYSAKKIGGRRSHKLARARARATLSDSQDCESKGALPDPTSVTVHAIDLVAFDGDRVTLRVDCSAGFYVRALAHDLGERLGTGAHLAALRRTRSGSITLADALPLAAAERDPAEAAARLIPLAGILPGLVAVVLTPEGVERATHGRELRGVDAVTGFGGWDSGLESRIPIHESRFFRLLDSAGELVAIAQQTPSGLLHPSVVLV